MSDENTTAASGSDAEGGTPSPAGASVPAHHAEVLTEQRKVHRFRVGWHADIVFDDQSTHAGFIHDISTQGASIYLGDSKISENATLHIHVPPLSLTSAPHVISVMARTVYVVYDGDRQMYRTAFMFVKFLRESDLAYLDERLSKYQLEIHEAEQQRILEL